MLRTQIQNPKKLKRRIIFVMAKLPQQDVMNKVNRRKYVYFIQIRVNSMKSSNKWAFTEINKTINLRSITVFQIHVQPFLLVSPRVYQRMLILI